MAATLPKPVLIVPGALCDEYGDLSKLKDDFAPTQSRYNKCREQLAKLVADCDPEAEYSVDGARYRVVISSRGLERRPDIEKVRKALGAAKFLEVATVTLRSLEAVMLRPDIDKICIVERTGPRAYAPIPIARP